MTPHERNWGWDYKVVGAMVVVDQQRLAVPKEFQVLWTWQSTKMSQCWGASRIIWREGFLEKMQGAVEIWREEEKTRKKRKWDIYEAAGVLANAPSSSWQE